MKINTNPNFLKPAEILQVVHVNLSNPEVSDTQFREIVRGLMDNNLASGYLRNQQTQYDFFNDTVQLVFPLNKKEGV